MTEELQPGLEAGAKAAVSVLDARRSGAGSGAQLCRGRGSMWGACQRGAVLLHCCLQREGKEGKKRRGRQRTRGNSFEKREEERADAGINK